MLLSRPAAPSRPLHVAAHPRPIRLLEVDEGVLAEILEDGCASVREREREREARSHRAARLSRQLPQFLSPPPPPPRSPHSVHIKATRAGPAVLCTATATYELKHVETTNKLLLVPEGEVRERGRERGGERFQNPGACPTHRARPPSPLSSCFRARRAPRLFTIREP